MAEVAGAVRAPCGLCWKARAASPWGQRVAKRSGAAARGRPVAESPHGLPPGGFTARAVKPFVFIIIIAITTTIIIVNCVTRISQRAAPRPAPSPRGTAAPPPPIATSPRLLRGDASPFAAPLTDREERRGCTWSELGVRGEPRHEAAPPRAALLPRLRFPLQLPGDPKDFNGPNRKDLLIEFSSRQLGEGAALRSEESPRPRGGTTATARPQRGHRARLPVRGAAVRADAVRAVHGMRSFPSRGRTGPPGGAHGGPIGDAGARGAAPGSAIPAGPERQRGCSPPCRRPFAPRVTPRVGHGSHRGPGIPRGGRKAPSAGSPRGYPSGDVVGTMPRERGAPRSSRPAAARGLAAPLFRALGDGHGRSLLGDGAAAAPCQAPRRSGPGLSDGQEGRGGFQWRCRRGEANPQPTAAVSPVKKRLGVISRPPLPAPANSVIFILSASPLSLLPRATSGAPLRGSSGVTADGWTPRPT